MYCVCLCVSVLSTEFIDGCHYQISSAVWCGLIPVKLWSSACHSLTDRQTDRQEDRTVYCTRLPFIGALMSLERLSSPLPLFVKYDSERMMAMIITEWSCTTVCCAEDNRLNHSFLPSPLWMFSQKTRLVCFFLSALYEEDKHSAFPSRCNRCVCFVLCSS